MRGDSNCSFRPSASGHDGPVSNIGFASRCFPVTSSCAISCPDPAMLRFSMPEDWSACWAGHIQDSEIEAIRALVLSDLPVSPYPYLRTGQRVRITDGPLTNVEGILVDRRADKGLLVLSVHLFRRSVAVEVDCALAVAA
jgi:hypothetical protein